MLILVSSICFAQENQPTENKIFLYVIIFGYDSTPKINRIKMPDIETCFKSVQNHESKISTGSEAEAGITIFCGTGAIEKCHNGNFNDSGRYCTELLKK